MSTGLPASSEASKQPWLRGHACPPFLQGMRPGSVSVGEWAPTVHRGGCAFSLRASQVLSRHVITRKASCAVGVKAQLFSLRVLASSDVQT